jgi:Domain of unknown function DUF29
MQATQIQTTSHHDLYQQDFYLWLEQTVVYLQTGELGKIDIENLIEEVEGMSSSQRQALRSNLEVVLMHLLKYKYQPEKRSNSWLLTLIEHRSRLHDALEESPSLTRYLETVIDKCYLKAKKIASLETGIVINIFPTELPFILEQILDEDYLPE